MTVTMAVTRTRMRTAARRNPTMALGIVVLAVIVLVALPVIARALGGRGAKSVPVEAQTITATYAGEGISR